VKSGEDKNSPTARRRCAAGVGAVVLLAPLIWIAYLVEALDQRDNTLSRFYRRIYPKLMRYGPEAKAAAPSLLSVLNDWDAEVRRAARNSLEKVDPKAAVKAGGAAHGQDH